MHLDREDFLVFGSPLLLEEDIQEVVDTLRSGWIGTGPKVARFEEAFLSLLKIPFAVAVNSCTAALSLALEISGVEPGDEVITTPLTFPATVNVIEHRGARPVFADVDRKTGNISSEEIAKRIGPRTKAIVPVHLAGRPCDMDGILALAQTNHLYVIEDAAHALEAEFREKRAGTIGDCGAFSFYPTKSLTTSEGGMLVTGREEWAARARVLRSHGISADAWARYSSSGFRHYETLYPGYKYNMTDLQAALGINQIKRLEQNLQHRELLWETYNAGLSSLRGLVLPAEPEERTRHARHLYTICVESSEAGLSRDELMDRLKEVKVGTGVHYTAVHLHKYYRQKYGYQRGDFPNAEWISDRTLSLPLTAKMGTDDAEYVIEGVRSALGYHS
ncbi:MAG: DegT/DnrJ/EryC1/StrS aminotransferase family protein [Chloroflexi bacterium]|nr:DegT/DnrJ/EryC1/StrS aminotransferase family protein [Chloroflexota bacterium]